MKLVAAYNPGNRLKICVELVVKVPRFTDSTYQLSKYLRIHKANPSNMIEEVLGNSGSEKEQEEYLKNTLYNSLFYIDYFRVDQAVMLFEPLKLYLVLCEYRNVSKYLTSKQVVDMCKESITNNFAVGAFYGPYYANYYNFTSLKVDRIETSKIGMLDVKSIFWKRNPEVINILDTTYI